ncbi:MAG: chitobiase/beta-hexosaminidase C-terminal domain-containing protein, partial [Bacteroidales bacterium]|nr:chitobiase/beta-hexosaminidase C-terminal domain-containing protein [Bacteroidales bacterium]
NITGQITVNVDWTDENDCEDAKSINYVYGGGNMAAYTPYYSSLLSPRVNIINATVSNAVFGGGYGSGATVTTNPLVVIGADRENNMAGSAAPASNLPVTIGATYNPYGATTDGDVFGGGNAAAVVGNTTVVIKGTGTRVYNNAYGGGNAATVIGNTDIQVGYDADLMPPVLTVDELGKMVITSTTAGATLYYTIDGTDPTAESDTYSTPLTLSSGQVIKAIAVKSGNTSAVAYNTVATPTIEIDGSGKATVSCTTPGVTLRYISGASPADPTANTGTVYNPENKPTVTVGHTIKVIAVRDGFAHSAIGSATR